MWRKISKFILFSLCFSILSIGFIKINGDITETMEKAKLSEKDKAPIKVAYTLSPFDFRVDIGQYIVSVNGTLFSTIKVTAGRSIDAIKVKTVKVVDTIWDKIDLK